MSTVDAFKRGIYRQCAELLREREALPWWNFWRFNAINRRIRELLEFVEDAHHDR